MSDAKPFDPPIDLKPGATDDEIVDEVREWIHDNENLWDFGGEYLLPDGRVVKAAWHCEESDDSVYFDDIVVTIEPAP